MLLCSGLLVSCQSAYVQNKSSDDVVKERRTLSDLAKGETAIAVDDKTSKIEDAQQLLTKQQRAAKLTSLYQSILSIEPDKEVRTKIAYRLVKIDTRAYELQDGSVKQKQANSLTLSELVTSYKTILERFPDRVENEEVHYQLAKALDLQGKTKESLLQIELILAKYPDSKYSAELHFRRGDIYYNLQHYTKALKEYQAVVKSKNNTKYYINSMYMSGWALFKLNRLAEADKHFIALIDTIIAQEETPPHENGFSFSSLDNRYTSLLTDIQRVLSISLSQQGQAKSLVSLVKNYQGNDYSPTYLYLYRHILFNNLADFLISNGLHFDAQLTYQSYITLAPNNLWSAKYSLLLMDLYRSQGKNEAIRDLKVKYVQQYGLESEFWRVNIIENQTNASRKEYIVGEVLPHLLSFSYQQGRYLYVKAQEESIASAKVRVFANSAHWLNVYLALANLPETKLLASKSIPSKNLLADELLFADASFEAQLYKQALISYEYIAYQTSVTSKDSDKLKRTAAYAATLTVRELLPLFNVDSNKTIESGQRSRFLNQQSKLFNESSFNNKEALLLARAKLDKAFIENYPEDKRATNIAVQLAQYAFSTENYSEMLFYSDFILKAYGVVKAKEVETKETDHKAHLAKLTNKDVKQVQIASQLQANYWYKQGKFQRAETSYKLALNYVVANSDTWLKIKDLVAASIYFQGHNLAVSQPESAVAHYLRLVKQVPKSSYSLNAQYDAANILFSLKHWQAAIDVYKAFQQSYPNHPYSHSIPTKLAHSFENLNQWQMAAEQYLVIVKREENEKSASDLHREALYSAAELFLKADNLAQAIRTFRQYAHTYPEPFEVAQEVRFKMSGFYQQTKEPAKEYYWYRKIIEFHDKKFGSKLVSNNSRAIHLASVSSLALGKAHQQTFNRSKLTLPLKKSLAKKQKSMKKAIQYYRKLLSFQSVEYVPQATFNIAQMYRQLSIDVMSSQRPKGLDSLALEEYNLLLEEITYPFEEQAIELHKGNAQRAWNDIYDQWIMKSFAELAELEPALYDRKHKLITNEFNEGGINGVIKIH